MTNTCKEGGARMNPAALFSDQYNVTNTKKFYEKTEFDIS